jgi:hypothetical protein
LAVADPTLDGLYAAAARADVERVTDTFDVDAVAAAVLLAMIVNDPNLRAHVRGVLGALAAAGCEMATRIVAGEGGVRG